MVKGIYLNTQSIEVPVTILKNMSWRYGVLFPMILALAGCPTSSGPGGGGSGINLGNILSGGPTGGTAGPANPVGGAPAPVPGTEGGDGGGGGQGATLDPPSGGSPSEDPSDPGQPSGGGVADSSGGASGPSGSAGSGEYGGSGSVAAGMGSIPETPITVVGSPMPMSPMDTCRTPCEPSFQDMQVVVAAGETPGVQVRGFLRCTEAAGTGKLASKVPASVRPIGLRMVSILDPLFPPEPRGYATANVLGCFLVNLQASSGRTVQFRASHCLQTFETDLVIPQPSEQQALESCPLPEQAEDASASDPKVKVFLKKSFSK